MKEYVGGYSDWKRVVERRSAERGGADRGERGERHGKGEEREEREQRGARESGDAARTPGSKARPQPERDHRAGRSDRPKKLSYNEQRELERLPGRIEELEAELAGLHERMADPDFYREEADDVAEVTSRADDIGSEIDAAFTRWSELSERAERAG